MEVITTSFPFNVSKKTMNEYLLLESHMAHLIEAVMPLLPVWVIEEATSLLNNREYGVAYELVCEHLYENGLPISRDIYSLAETAGREMELDPKSWQFIEPLVT